VKVVQELLGHSSITLTLDTYSHVTPAMQRESADAMNTILRAKMEPHAS
jgi:integrase